MSDLIQKRESKRYPGLFVKKYSRKVFYDALWNTDPALMEARGHVEDKLGNIVIRPFTKIFNRGENDTDIDRNEDVLAIRKINGFMAAATYVPYVGSVVVSTTGSLDSDFIGYAETYITPEVKRAIFNLFHEMKKPVTFLFEICHPDDPHIVAENAGAYLIGMREVDNDLPYFSSSVDEVMLDSIAGQLKVFRPTWKHTRFSDVVKAAAECKHEGYVVYGQTSRTALKIKSPYYLTLKACARKKDIESLDKQRVDEEFYDLIAHLKTLGPAFNEMEEQARLEYMVNWLNHDQ